MYWKCIGVIFLGFFIFILGFALGGISWSWTSSTHSSEVAFWSMLGGWVSGLATLAAVIVSLAVAYQASQAGVEKLEVSFEHMYARNLPKKDQRLAPSDTANIKVKNLRDIPTEIVAIYLNLDGASQRLNIGFMKSGGKGIPHLLQRTGETWEFAFGMKDSTNLVKAMTYFSQNGKPSFEKGFFTIETTMKQYNLKIEKDLLRIMYLCYQDLVSKNKERNCISGD